MLYNTYNPAINSARYNPPRGLDYDVVRSEEGVTVRVDIPGVDPASIDLTVDGRSLHLEGNRQTEIPEGARVASNRRGNGVVSQSFELGDRLDADQLTADYEFGVLTISIPVAESAKPRKVAVGASPSAAIDATAEAVADEA